MSAFDDVLAANAQHAAAFSDPGLAGRAAKGLALVTCMDSRIDPLGVFGLVPGDAKILRTAGARVTDDVLRSLVLAHHLLGVERVVVMAHTDCGMAKATDADVHAAVRARSGVDSRSVDFHTIADQRATLEHDVQRVRSSPYLPPGMPVIGAVYDVRSGAVTVVVHEALEDAPPGPVLQVLEADESVPPRPEEEAADAARAGTAPVTPPPGA